jgi:hypothetical protein
MLSPLYPEVTMHRPWTLLLLFLTSLPAAVSAQTRSEQGIWKLTTRPVDALVSDERGRQYWVGLQNLSSRAGAFCGFTVRYRFDRTDGLWTDQASSEYPDIGPRVPCAGASTHLVLPGETYFVLIRVSLPLDAVAAKPVLFRVIAEEACAAPVPCSAQAIYLAQE